jgi:hypothetical protein
MRIKRFGDESMSDACQRTDVNNIHICKEILRAWLLIKIRSDLKGLIKK